MAKENELLPGPLPKDIGIEPLIDAAKMAELLHRAQALTDEAFEELVDDIGVRAARLVLRAKALRGDVKALDLYFRLAKESKRERQAARDRAQETRDVTPSGFLPKDRSNP